MFRLYGTTTLVVTTYDLHSKCFVSFGLICLMLNVASKCRQTNPPHMRRLARENLASITSRTWRMLLRIEGKAGKNSPTELSKIYL